MQCSVAWPRFDGGLRAAYCGTQPTRTMRNVRALLHCDALHTQVVVNKSDLVSPAQLREVSMAMLTEVTPTVDILTMAALTMATLTVAILAVAILAVALRQCLFFA